MATGQKKGKMITLWVLRVVVGLAFLAAGGSKLAGLLQWWQCSQR
jgi:hypothetical protein